MSQSNGLSVIDPVFQETLASSEASFFQLELIRKTIPIQHCVYKISNKKEKMSTSESIAISAKGILFLSEISYDLKELLRIHVELPNYWILKSKIVEYRHTEAPKYFQMLVRVNHAKETAISDRFEILCETLNLNNIDEMILQNYLTHKEKKK